MVRFLKAILTRHHVTVRARRIKSQIIGEIATDVRVAADLARRATRKASSVYSRLVRLEATRVLCLTSMSWRLDAAARSPFGVEGDSGQIDRCTALWTPCPSY